MFNLGFSELILLAIIALIFIGPKQLPEIARTIGRTLNELKRATGDLTSTISNPSHYVDREIKKAAETPPPAKEAPTAANVEDTEKENKS